MGYDLTEPVRHTILALDESAWASAIGQDGEPREGAFVAELTDAVDLGGWPEARRRSCSAERPHPGAQLSLTEHDRHRLLATLTTSPATLEQLHCARAPNAGTGLPLGVSRVAARPARSGSAS
jgi:hypothetical protein